MVGSSDSGKRDRGQRGKSPGNRFFILFHLNGQIRFKRVGKSFLKMDFLGSHGECQFYKEWGGGWETALDSGYRIKRNDVSSTTALL